MAYGGNLGAAGTRLTKRLGLDDEVLAYVLQSVVGALALDSVLTLVLMSYMIVGWWSLVILLSVCGFLIGLIVLVFGRPSGRFARFVLGNLWAVGALIPLFPLFSAGRAVGVLGQRWYRMLQLGALLVAEQIGTIFGQPWWAYTALGVALLVIVLYGRWKTAAALLVALVVVAVILLSDGDAWLQAWRSLKWLLIPYSWPVIGFALLLALVMGKEMLFPNLEWTFKPVSLEELRETGLIGLWLPGVVGKAEQDEPRPERTVRVELHEKGENGRGARERYAFLSDSNEARQFYAAVKRGESFALRTARKHGLSRRGFESIRGAFFARGWAQWHDEQHHEQGIDLLDAGNEVIERIAMVGTTP